MSRSNDDNHANQCNPNNDAYWESRGEVGRPGDWEDRIEAEEGEADSDDDNHANQCNQNNDAYWESRGQDGRPDDWEDRVYSDD